MFKKIPVFIINLFNIIYHNGVFRLNKEDLRMKRVLMILFLLFTMMSVPVFADRNTSTIKSYTSSALVKRGDWKVYRITYIVSSNGGSFTLYDDYNGNGSTTNIKTEGSEATANNGDEYDFSNKPLEGSSGLYLYINNCSVVIEYE